MYSSYSSPFHPSGPLTYAPKPGTPVGDTPEEKKKDQEFREKFAPVVLWKTPLTIGQLTQPLTTDN